MRNEDILDFLSNCDEVYNSPNSKGLTVAHWVNFPVSFIGLYFLLRCSVPRNRKKITGDFECLCVHVHVSKCNFWITFSHFPLNFISSVISSEIAGWLSFPIASGVCGHCSRLWRQQSCRWWTTPLIPLCFLYRPRQSSQFASVLLSCMSLCQERKRKGSWGSIESKKRVFPLCSFAWQNANIHPEATTEEAAYEFEYVYYLW